MKKKPSKNTLVGRTFRIDAKALRRSIMKNALALSLHIAKLAEGATVKESKYADQLIIYKNKNGERSCIGTKFVIWESE